MPWVTKYNSYAAGKKEAYERLESKLKDKKKKISNILWDLKNRKTVLSNQVNYLGSLSGDFLYKYENKRDYFFQQYTSIIGEFEKFINDLERAISQCSSKKQEWNSKIYTREWEDEPRENNYARY